MRLVRRFLYLLKFGEEVKRERFLIVKYSCWWIGLKHAWQSSLDRSKMKSSESLLGSPIQFTCCRHIHRACICLPLDDKQCSEHGLQVGLRAWILFEQNGFWLVFFIIWAARHKSDSVWPFCFMPNRQKEKKWKDWSAQSCSRPFKIGKNPRNGRKLRNSSIPNGSTNWLRKVFTLSQTWFALRYFLGVISAWIFVLHTANLQKKEMCHDYLHHGFLARLDSRAMADGVGTGLGDGQVSTAWWKLGLAQPRKP